MLNKLVNNYYFHIFMKNNCSKTNPLVSKHIHFQFSSYHLKNTRFKSKYGNQNKFIIQSLPLHPLHTWFLL